MRARVRAAATGLIRAAGRGLFAGDEIRRAWFHSFGPDEEEGAGDARPAVVVAAVAHWRDPSAPAEIALERRRHLAACAESVLGLDVDRVVVAVLTNDARQVAQDLAFDLDLVSAQAGTLRILDNADAFEPPFNEPRQIFSIGWKPGRFARVASRTPGFYLTWGHKAVLRRVFRDPKPSLLIYLEDDIRFTDESLAYWCRYRKPLAEIGLLPGFVRYEERDGVRYVVDQVRRQVIRREVSLRGVDGEPTFTELENPYQGMYVLDRPLADRHVCYSSFRGPLRSSVASSLGGHWNIRERAAAGPIFDDVPTGFRSRNVVPIRDGSRAPTGPDPMCLLQHMGRTYVDRNDSPFGKLRVENLFEVS
jgi:hypothetical protein